MPIRWIAWDLGGTLTEWSLDRHVRWLAKRYKLPRRTIEREWQHRRRLLDVSAISWKEYWDHHQRAFRTKDPHTVPKAHEIALNAPRASTLRLVRALRPRYRMALVTNIPPNHLADIDRRVGVRKYMDVIVRSDTDHVEKPDAAYWRLLCKRTRAKPREIVVIDDLAHNAEGARAFGLHAIHFTTAARLRRDLRRLGVR